MESFIAAQLNLERRYNCIVCMEAKLEMVYGSCQHKLCSSCLYRRNGTLKSEMVTCPVCAKYMAFPYTRPDIPEDNIENQKMLGIRECQNKEAGCKYQMWDWELEEHARACPFEKPRAPRQRRSSSRVKSQVSHSNKQEARYMTRGKRRASDDNTKHLYKRH